jgi:hypothetical protein
MRNLSDPEYIAKLLEASRVMNPHYIEIHEGAYAKSDETGYYYYGGMSLIIEGQRDELRSLNEAALTTRSRCFYAPVLSDPKI